MEKTLESIIYLSQSFHSKARISSFVNWKVLQSIQESIRFHQSLWMDHQNGPTNIAGKNCYYQPKLCQMVV